MAAMARCRNAKGRHGTLIVQDRLKRLFRKSPDILSIFTVIFAASNIQGFGNRSAELGHKLPLPVTSAHTDSIHEYAHQMSDARLR